MLATQFSTAHLASAEHTDAWQRWFWPVFDVEPGASAPESFVASNHVWNVGGLVVSYVAAPSATVVRGKKNLASAPVDHWVLGLCHKGETGIETARSTLHAPAGIPFLWSLGEASRTERTAIERVQILMPRDMFPDIRAELDTLRGSVLDTPAGVVLAEYMTALERWLPVLAPEALPRVAAAIHNMIAACLVPGTGNLERAQVEIGCFLKDRVKQAVKTHLRSPSLGPKALCKMVGMSRSSLYRLFMYEGGIMHYIQHQRLLEAHALLSDPHNRLTIVAISEQLCFSDATSFSRAFRREFGNCPSEVRQAAARGDPLPAYSLPREGTIETFADILRS